MTAVAAPFYVEVVWNREFHFVPFGASHSDLDVAIKAARAAENMGDGAEVKKARVVDSNGAVVWQHGKKVAA